MYELKGQLRVEDNGNRKITGIVTQDYVIHDKESHFLCIQAIQNKLTNLIEKLDEFKKNMRTMCLLSMVS